MKPRWLPRWLTGEVVVLDEAGNTMLFPKSGNPHETISAHCGAQYAHKNTCWFCRAVCQSIQKGLGWIWPNLKTHCANSWEKEKALVRDSQGLPGVS